jgi:uncharacterized RDD family membrane protein YckC
MALVAPHERLRSARIEHGEELSALASRTGLRVHHIQAIEEGRFTDLPRGIYGRAAIRTFAKAYALDADGMVAECETLLPQIDDPIAALSRMRGMTPAVHALSDSAPTKATAPGGSPAWRPFAAATLDGAVAALLLVVACAGAALVVRMPISALGSSASALFALGLVLAAAYYVCLGGLSGTTLGESAVGATHAARDPRPLTLRAIVLRTLAAATADARAIHGVGMWTARVLTRPGAARSVRPPAPSPLPPPPPGRVEALTWSTTGRACVPPPPLRPRRVRTLPRSPSRVS